MQALILAAGMGKRLKDLTQNNTKCMVEVNGATLIERVLHQLDRCSLSKIVIVIGYEGQKLIDYISTLDIKTQIEFVDNPVYYKTNNIYSLAMAKDYLLQEDTILLESDLIFEDSVLDELINDPRDTLALVDKYESWMDGTCIKIGPDDSIAAFVPGKKFNYNECDEYYKTVNIYKFSKLFSVSHYVPFLDAYSKALGNNEYYEQVLRVIAELDDPVIKAKKLTGQLWYEIDDIQDLDIAETMFENDDNIRLGRIENRFGGYWRYPKLIDFCYLVNPYFPPKKMINEMKASFEKLLTQYPSGMRVNSLLASKNFGVKQDYIVVGNGAAELIKCLMEKTTGKVGFIRPTFEEYPNRYDKNNSVIYIPEHTDFVYQAQDIINYFDATDIKSLILINPDNPTGNYICKNDLFTLLNWSNAKGIKMIIDESFVDFADEEDSSILDNNILEEYPLLVVVKSISKSYGVPGVRLGILATSDKEMIANMKKEVSIWNINSFGEFYMQIEEKYKKDYEAALVKIRKTRANFIDNLNQINGLHVIPSQANYVMIEIINGMSSRELTKKLLFKHDLLIKDLTPKMNRENRQFIRVAIRNEEDNEKLINALKINLLSESRQS